MKRFILSSLAAISLATAANAETHSDVMEPYEAFKQDMAAQDYESAAANAYAAWRLAEKEIGDHPKTGVLALNYAYLHYNVDLQRKRVAEAYMRGIELSQSSKEQKRLTRLLKAYVIDQDSDQFRRRVNNQFQKRFGKTQAPNPFLSKSGSRVSINSGNYNNRRTGAGIEAYASKRP